MNETLAHRGPDSDGSLTFVAVDPDTGEQAAVDPDTGEFVSLQASTADQPEVNPPQPPPQLARAPGRRG